MDDRTSLQAAEGIQAKDKRSSAVGFLLAGDSGLGLLLVGLGFKFAV